MSADPESRGEDWPPRWYRSRPEVLTYEQILNLVRQNGVLETKLDGAVHQLEKLNDKVSSLELSRAAASAQEGMGKWIINAFVALAVAAIGAVAGVWWDKH